MAGLLRERLANLEPSCATSVHARQPHQDNSISILLHQCIVIDLCQITWYDWKTAEGILFTLKAATWPFNMESARKFGSRKINSTLLIFLAIYSNFDTVYSCLNLMLEACEVNPQHGETNSPKGHHGGASRVHFFTRFFFCGQHCSRVSVLVLVTQLLALQ